MGGRDKVLAELATARSEGRVDHVAVLDADYDRIEDKLGDEPNVVWTDYHDLEVTLIASPALDKVLVELGSQEKCEKFEKEERCAVREALLSLGCELARLRWLSRRESLALTFRKQKADVFSYVDYHAFCDRASWEVDRREMVRVVLNFSLQHKLKADDLLARMDALPEIDSLQLCVGHDLVGLLSVGLRSKLGSHNRLSIEDLQERLRLAFERAHLERTEMYRSLRVWEQHNAPYRIFPD